MQGSESDMPVQVAALYRFARFDTPYDLQQPLLDLCLMHSVRGTLLVATEGINGTIAGSVESIGQILAYIRTLPGCADLDVKYSRAAVMPFGRMKVRVKREIVTMGEGDIDPATQAGTYVAPRDWAALLADPNTILIDTRNAYEVGIGTFSGAIDPGIGAFREFPAWFDRMAEQWEREGRSPKIAMFCTGGIRCEKSTAYARSRGFEDVYHLQGGILRYLEEIPEAESDWNGECFVFDERVAIGHGLNEGSHILCQSCGDPIAQSLFDQHVAGCDVQSWHQ
jgi:UPF0176 protein